METLSCEKDDDITSECGEAGGAEAKTWVEETPKVGPKGPLPSGPDSPGPTQLPRWVLRRL